MYIKYRYICAHVTASVSIYSKAVNRCLYPSKSLHYQHLCMGVACKQKAAPLCHLSFPEELQDLPCHCNHLEHSTGALQQTK